MVTMKRVFAGAILILVLFPAFSHAEVNAVGDTQTYQKARVINVLDQKTAIIPGTGTPAQTQTLQAEILDGPNTGTTVTFENDYPVQLEKGGTFYARHITSTLDGTDMWSVADPYRLPVLAILAVAFVALLFLFGGIQGVRGFTSLGGSILLIFYVLIPGIYSGYSPILVSIGVASLIVIVGSYITHGFNRATSAAILGMISTVLVTGAAAYWVVHAAHLSGYTGDEQVYLNFDTHGGIDMVGLLFGGIMIGLLGVLYDIAIGQAIAVEELFSAGAHLGHPEVYRRAIRIGREHIGALVNTLAIAYVGASLPLLLLIQSSDTGILFMLNSEIFATEIVRILIGSIGLILGVPITTLIATYMLAGQPHAGHAHEGHRHHH
ncbi:YibE/F family protein [Candidatus Kaiserbacteria bacterium]|nr:YibE/F family protein [Candidatus Kaiserbacteria bacterium]